jgi:HPt (histidine-containing phosphotransfer) domain-containing protein
MAGESRKTVSLKEKEAAAKIKIEGMDIKQGIFLSGGTVESFMETLSMFYKDGLEKLKDLKVCLEAKNLDLFTIHVHALKSASANIGAAVLSKTAASLEAAGERKDVSYIESHTHELFGALESLLERINDELERYRKKETTNKKNCDVEVLNYKLLELKTGLVNLDAGIINRSIQELQVYTQQSDFGIKIENIAEKILLG